jgi:PAS domain S-box-containing protein
MAKVLVVDDHPVNRNLLATLLGYGGHTVYEAGDGAQALSAAQAERPDLIITDLLMPVMDGYELVRELRGQPALAATRVIFYTANYIQDEVRPVAAALGVRHIISKPAEPERILATVEAALATAGPEPVSPPSKEYHQEHMRALSAKLVEKIEQLEAAEERLTQSEARFRCLAEYAPIGIFSLDSGGLVRYANPRLRLICGLTTDVPPDGLMDLVHPEDRHRVATRLTAAIAGRASFRERMRVVQPSGALRWVDSQAAPLADESGQISYVGTVDDITETVLAQRERDEVAARLAVAERLESLGQLAAGVAHDFNNLLGVMLNYTQFVADGLEELAKTVNDPRLAEIRDDTGAIDTAVRSAADLTHQLLIFGRREIIQPEVVDLNDLIEDTESLLARTIGEHVLLKSKLAQDLWPVKADPRRLQQVIINLVVNARDAISEAGTVLITTTNVELDESAAMLHAAAKPGSYACIAVVDDGAGMTQQTIARAFEPFFTTKPRGKGTGLGLATVHGIVSQIGGYVGVYSEPGQGTAVRVYLPAAQGTPGAPTGPTEDVAGGHGELVLVVEDDYAVRAVTTRILENYGYAVIAAGDGQVALAVLEDKHTAVDLLLTDMVMPTMSGKEIAGRAGHLRPGLPVLFMSGYAGGLVGTNTTLDEGVDLLEKPFTRSSLLSAVTRVLGGRPDPRDP